MDEDVPRREGRVTAKGDLDRWREPPQLIIGIVALRRDRECGLCEIILRSDRLHDAVGKPAVKRHDRRRVSGQRLLGECVHLKERDSSHEAFSVISGGSMVSRSV